MTSYAVYALERLSDSELASIDVYAANIAFEDLQHAKNVSLSTTDGPSMCDFYQGNHSPTDLLCYPSSNDTNERLLNVSFSRFLQQFQAARERTTPDLTPDGVLFNDSLELFLADFDYLYDPDKEDIPGDIILFEGININNGENQPMLIGPIISKRLQTDNTVTIEIQNFQGGIHIDAIKLGHTDRAFQGPSLGALNVHINGSVQMSIRLGIDPPATTP